MLGIYQLEWKALISIEMEWKALSSLRLILKTSKQYFGKKIWFSSSRFRNCIVPFTISYSICFICNNKEKQETIPEMHLYLEGLVN